MKTAEILKKSAGIISLRYRVFFFTLLHYIGLQIYILFAECAQIYYGRLVILPMAGIRYRIYKSLKMYHGTNSTLWYRYTHALKKPSVFTFIYLFVKHAQVA